MLRPSSTCAGVTLLRADIPHEALLLKSRQGGQRFLDRAFGRALAIHDPQVHHVHHLAPKVTKVFVDRALQILLRHRRVPGTVRAPEGPDLGHEGQAVRIGMQRLADNLVGNVRAVEIARVDVVHAAFDRLAQNGDRRVAILWRAEDVGAGELHGAVAHAVQLDGGAGEGEGAAEVFGQGHGVLLFLDRRWTCFCRAIRREETDGPCGKGER